MSTTPLSLATSASNSIDVKARPAIPPQRTLGTGMFLGAAIWRKEKAAEYGINLQVSTVETEGHIFNTSNRQLVPTPD